MTTEKGSPIRGFVKTQEFRPNLPAASRADKSDPFIQPVLVRVTSVAAEPFLPTRFSPLICFSHLSADRQAHLVCSRSVAAGLFTERPPRLRGDPRTVCTAPLPI